MEVAVESPDLRQAAWRKSSLSGDGNCVEVATTSVAIGVRDSKDVVGPYLAFSPSAWSDFIDAVKSGEFDLP